MGGDSDEAEKQKEFFPKIPLLISSSKWEDEPAFLLHGSSSNMWPMVSIKDSQDSSIVFPPINHENLPTTHLRKPPAAASFMFFPSSSSSSSSSSLSDDNDVETSDSTLTLYSSSSGECGRKMGPGSKISRLGGVVRWMNFGLGVFYSKVRGRFLSVQFSWRVRFTVVIAVVMGFLYVGFWKRLRRRNESVDQLRRLIREKDESINLLLHQIAQMNKLLLAQK